MPGVGAPLHDLVAIGLLYVLLVAGGRLVLVRNLHKRQTHSGKGYIHCVWINSLDLVIQVVQGRSHRETRSRRVLDTSLETRV